MHAPVQHYRGYDILCSASGYTLLRNDVEILSVGHRDAGNRLQDCAHLAHLFEQAKQSIDRLLDGA
jgi:hypothetical protein